MINEGATFRWKGYRSTDLSRGSGKRVWANCDNCGHGRWVEFKQYSDLCSKCVCMTEEYRKKMSELSKGENNYWFGKHHTDGTKELMREVKKGKCDGEDNPMYGRRHSGKSKMQTSEALIGEKNPNWKGGVSFEPYCEKFNEAFKELVREKFGWLCFMCTKTEKSNGRKLDVHHVSYDKECICNGLECEFVPLCARCHGKTGHDRELWERLIINTLDYEGWI